MGRDPLVNRVLQKMFSRSEAGMEKYGVTMERTDIGTREWLSHAQEEAMDLAIYLQRCIEDIDKKDWNSSYPTKKQQNT